ncbi:hypothetical protein [Spirosoma endbachense]|uniref:Uncharacterized protein n=1 Tax=Spirosoma endbachense TaxID=2666025 RepID=A0A6P1VP40_9BACT|nr:hypothetical protein [Spirosoma endbachense]QHV94475.1 hypothetical protein GJR95_05350 [Spirosoma endbachense]
MNRNFLIIGLLAAATVASGIGAHAQNRDAEKYNNYYIVNHDKSGTLKETVHTFYEGHEYLFALSNGILDELRVDEEKIPADNYAPYNGVINTIRKQLAKDQLEESRNQKKRVHEQDFQASVNTRYTLTEAHDVNSQTRFDQEQIHASQTHTGISHENVDADQTMMSNMIDDLIKDSIVSSQKELVSVTLSATEMTVNGKKLPSAIFSRYKEKYSMWAAGNFSYGGNQQSHSGIHIRRRND